MQKSFSICVLLLENITANFRAEFPNPYTGIFILLIIGGIWTRHQVWNKPVSPAGRT